MPSFDIASESELSAKINQLLTLKRYKQSYLTSDHSRAIQSLDSLLLECQDFVNDLSDSDEYISTAIYEKEEPHEKESRKRSKVFLEAIQSLHIPIFGKTSHKNARKTRFSFESFKTQISKIVSYRMPTPPLEERSPRETRSKSLGNLKFTKSVFF